MMKKLLLCIAMLALFFSHLSGQNVTVKGKVTDGTGTPLEGVTVLIIGDNLVGTETDAQGAFSINASVGQSLKLVCIGYKDVIKTITGADQLSITMEEDTQFIEDAVVIGYGSARKGDLTSSISSVNGDVLVNRGRQNLSVALQGQMAGVQVTRSSGAPGAGATIRVRGETTMSTNDPLIIIDGIPGSLTNVDTEDIETITVLKDASAASIYGARAAAGVILITTKRAKTGQFSLNYKYEFGLDTPTAAPKMSDAVTYMRLFNEQKWNDGAEEYGTYRQDYLDSYMSNNAVDPIHYPNTDWLGLVMKKQPRIKGILSM